MQTRFASLVILAASSLVACGENAPLPPSPAQIAAREEKEKEKKLEKDYARIERFAEGHPTELDGIRRRISEFLMAAEGTSQGNQASRLLQTAENKFEGICRDDFEKIEKRISRYLEDEDFESALKQVKTYPQDRVIPEIETKLAEMLERFEREVRADDNYYNVKRKAEERSSNGEYDRALATVRAFIENPLYAGTAAAKRLEPVIEEIEGKKTVAAEMEAEAERGWEVLFDGKDDSKWDYGGNEAYWEVKGGAMVAKNTSGINIAATTGSEDWKDYYVEFRFMLVRGDFHFGCRGEPASDSSGDWVFSFSGAPGADYERGKWYEIRCEVTGKQLKWIRKDNLRSRIFVASREKGPIALFLKPDCEVHLKGIQIKHLGG
ncbi:MAG: hypothetical protein O7H41_10640 [Planctomycetota bacterium]|nr:hypothetical protein [Planctomycetota bacterium]